MAVDLKRFVQRPLADSDEVAEVTRIANALLEHLSTADASERRAKPKPMTTNGLVGRLACRIVYAQKYVEVNVRTAGLPRSFLSIARRLACSCRTMRIDGSGQGDHDALT